MNPENYMGSRRRCCQKDGCNQDPLPAFVRNQTENGLRCPSCIAAFTETCTASEEVLCVGEETRCVAVSGLVQPGYPLSCEVCVGDGPSCTGKLQTCAPDEDSCIIVVTETNRKASLAVTSYKGCAKSSECESGLFGITMNPENYMGSRRRCCQKDGCNQDPLPAFVRNHTENGLRCPSCIAAFTETCTASEEALCVGEETRCVALSGLVQPGYPLSCEVCVGDGPSCTGKLQTCAPDEDSCIIVVTETNRKASLAVTSYKGCAKSSECESGLFGITMNPENYMGSRRRCCQKDGCNQDPLPAFVRNHTENGLRCPSCIAAFTETCTASEEALCVGEETRCVALSGLVQPEASLAVTSYKGCAKSSECESGLFGITMNPENYMGSRRRCCQKDGCNQDPLPAFVRNHTENGLRCPSCIAAFTETCTASEEALCVGEETRCVAVSGLVQPVLETWNCRVTHQSIMKPSAKPETFLLATALLCTLLGLEASLAVTSYKGCAKSSECESGLFGITVNPENYMGSRRRCCQKDGCNQDPLPAFVRNQTENGLRCPSCIAAFTETCTASEEALCVGEETRCVAVSGLVQPGYPLSCEMCIRNGAICIGEMKPCALDEDTCVVIMTETNNSKRVENSVRSWGEGSVDVTSYKGCSKSSKCDPAFLSFTVAPENYMGSDTHCCQSNGCNKDPLPAFRRNLTKNGLRCPSCSTFLKETCTPTDETLCFGEETRCVTVTGLMHPGHPLDCWVCISPGPFCHGTMQPCAPEEDTCMAAVYETHRVGDVLVSSKKGCTTSSDCDSGFLSFNDGPESNIGSTMRCCQSNGCNKDPLPAFRRNLTKNGLRCPSCSTFLKETCTPTDETLCFGEETRCVTVTGLMHPEAPELQRRSITLDITMQLKSDRG
ncbi:hypothetical protein MJG53_013514 [Ovis ammon polii x Ovis aries]|uniref:Uncharacterized protein n=1 Tax=Ovis ammon polii x Ovis aries TaxID=2918886 RepID=A0ACB9UJ27_9CETA|nr:hypothetical protein MJG53_013514 [Ovis ammon polii x Ovis aries]